MEEIEELDSFKTTTQKTYVGYDRNTESNRLSESRKDKLRNSHFKLSWEGEEAIDQLRARRLQREQEEQEAQSSPRPTPATEKLADQLKQKREEQQSEADTHQIPQDTAQEDASNTMTSPRQKHTMVVPDSSPYKTTYSRTFEHDNKILEVPGRFTHRPPQHVMPVRSNDKVEFVSSYSASYGSHNQTNKTGKL